ncbi:MAG TPA: hypothetical protein VFW07_21895 [Parafilimonas sp.]|nr:hypothetical protein [Parafilimonas sp.]
MKEMIINIPDDSTTLVTELVEKLGGSVKEKKAKSDLEKKNLKKDKPEPTFLFGKWKSFNIDPKKLREELWTRKF